MAPFNLLMNSLLEQPTQTVCFTGHRPGEKIPYDETTSIVKKIKASLREQILKAISEGFFIFISGRSRRERGTAERGARSATPEGGCAPRRRRPGGTAASQETPLR